MTYTYDNYTNEGIQTTLAVNKQLMLQLGASVGSEAAFWHMGEKLHNPYPSQLYPANYFPKDPGAIPSFTACFRLDWNDGNDNIYPCADSINSGVWGYNNLQWYGTTYYHKFNDKWHISYELYDVHESNVPNAANPVVQNIVANGGTPFANFAANAPNMAICPNPNELKCKAESIGTVAYLNYSPEPLDNFSFRPEFFDDKQGQRTGTKADYYALSFGWQHWLSPQIEFRPEIGYYRSVDAKAFNGGTNANLAPNKNYTVLGASDVIIHF
jgi:hypothetical protein